MIVLANLIRWAGGGAFVASLALGAYTYAVRWSQPGRGAGLPVAAAVTLNAVLFLVFASHHSLLAREGAKRWLARAVPPDLLRSFYVWVASLLFMALMAGWQPIGGEVYRLGGAAALSSTLAQLLGLGLGASSVRAIDALDLAGIRRDGPAGPLRTAGPYRLVRHPLYLGWILVVFGAARMTGDRFAFAVLSTAYLLVAIPWEERSLRRAFGAQYDAYRRLVRWRVLPLVY